MAILVTPQTKLLVQGITGEFGARHAKLSLDYGTQVVAGVTPGKGGQFFEHGGHKVPIFDTVADAVKQTGATAPPGRRMGHAGAIVSGGKGTAEAKIAAFKAAGIGIAATPSDMADTLLKMM